MSTSKIEICNVALAMLGADSIRSFDENNKRARMADVFFDFTRDYLLAKFDWPFARKYAKLQALDPSDTTIPGIPAGMYPYQLPSDCQTPRDMHPPGSKDRWGVMANVFYCSIPPGGGDVAIYYTIRAVNPTDYSGPFSNLLALGLAVKMSAAIAQDAALTKALQDQFIAEQQNAWESDANIGNDYRAYDESPENDSFVNPPGNEFSSDEIDPTWRS